MSEVHKYLIVITGATAVGKTGLTIALSQHLNGVIVSADSRQIYKEMTIGTAKPTTHEISSGPISLVNHVSVTDSYSASRYEEEALNEIKRIQSIGKMPILSGGTGLYIKAVCEGLDNIPLVTQSVSDKIENDLKTNKEAILKELESSDPASFSIVDKANDRRLIRMIGVTRETGKPFSTFLNQAKTARPFTPIYINLDRPREELYLRINSRVVAMMDSGLVTEVESLMKFRNNRALDTVGYREIFKYLDGVIDKDEAIELIQRNSRRYAKRQMTWNRNQIQAKNFHPDQMEDIKQYLSRILHSA